MRVRVYDPDRKGCFCAELYALFGSGIYEQCLVVQDGFLRCFPRVLPRPSDGHYETQVSFLDPELPADWIALPDAVPAFHGYPWVREDPAVLSRLLAGEAIPLAGTSLAEHPVSSLLPGWNYVTTQDQADALLEQAEGFHDSVLAQLHYVSGSCLNPDGSLTVSDHIRQVTMEFHSQWCPPLELVFEAVKALNLRPGGTQSVSALWEATIRVRDAAIFFCDGSCEDEAAYPGTKIWAYSLRWRFLKPLTTSKEKEFKII